MSIHMWAFSFLTELSGTLLMIAHVVSGREAAGYIIMYDGGRFTRPGSRNHADPVFPED